MRKHVETAWRASKRKESLRSRFHRYVRHKCGKIGGEKVKCGFPFSMDVSGTSVEILHILSSFPFLLRNGEIWYNIRRKLKRFEKFEKFERFEKLSAIKRFEDLVAWQEARKLAALVYTLCRKSCLAKDFGMRDQIQRAAVSVGSNIAEGFERSGNKELSYFLWIAKGSAGEVASQLYNLLDADYITQSEFDEAYAVARHCSYLLYQFLESLKASDFKGAKYATSQTSRTSRTSRT